MRIEKRERSISLRIKNYDKETRVYIWPGNESILDQMTTRLCRPHTIWRKEIMPKVLQELGLPLDTEVKWSQYAGCSCPCSPGFIIKGHCEHMDVHVYLTDKPVEVKVPELVVESVEVKVPELVV